LITYFPYFPVSGYPEGSWNTGGFFPLGCCETASRMPGGMTNAAVGRLNPVCKNILRDDFVFIVSPLEARICGGRVFPKSLMHVPDKTKISGKTYANYMWLMLVLEGKFAVTDSGKDFRRKKTLF
jgi:hypothetical protein